MPTRVWRAQVAAAVLAVALSLTGCSPPFAFQAWLLPVPEGTPTIGYRDVSPGERQAAEPITLVEELLIGPRGDDPAYLFGRSAPRIAVAGDGRIFVLDGGNYRVQAFDPGGELLATMGRQGQGPGEFGQAADLLIAGEVVLVSDVRNRRTTRWSLDGELVGSDPDAVWGAPIVPLAAGDVVWRAAERTPEGRDLMFRRVTTSQQVLVEYARMPWPERVVDPPRGMISGTESNAWWAGIVPPSFHADPDGTVYVSPFEEYQIFAYAPEGQMRWALQADPQRPPLSQVEIDFFMAEHARRFPERNASQVPWPERQYALGDLRVDGHGHLYVFPYVPKGTPSSASRPVDIYSREGGRLYSGTMSGRMFSAAFATYNGPMLDVAWQVARGDGVWGVAEAAGTGDYQVVRYRLVEPF